MAEPHYAAAFLKLFYLVSLASRCHHFRSYCSTGSASLIVFLESVLLPPRPISSNGLHLALSFWGFVFRHSTHDVSFLALPLVADPFWR